MATVVEQTITLRFSRLVKTNDENSNALGDESLVSLLETLPGVLEQLVDDQKIVIEIEV
jgi:hypothetical protein